MFLIAREKYFTVHLVLSQYNVDINKMRPTCLGQVRCPYCPGRLGLAFPLWRVLQRQGMCLQHLFTSTHHPHPSAQCLACPSNLFLALQSSFWRFLFTMERTLSFLEFTALFLRCSICKLCLDTFDTQLAAS